MHGRFENINELNCLRWELISISEVIIDILDNFEFLGGPAHRRSNSGNGKGLLAPPPPLSHPMLVTLLIISKFDFYCRPK